MILCVHLVFFIVTPKRTLIFDLIHFIRVQYGNVLLRNFQIFKI